MTLCRLVKPILKPPDRYMYVRTQAHTHTNTHTHAETICHRGTGVRNQATDGKGGKGQTGCLQFLISRPNGESQTKLPY